MSALDQRLRETLAESSAGLHGSGLYGLKSYWDERYERQPMKRGVGMWFEEWYAPYACGLREAILPMLDPSGRDRILHIGCGQSKLGADIYADGYCNVLNMDISEACVRQIAAVYDTLYPKMHSRVMDMTCLDLASASCEVILDKGSIDALMCTGSTPDGAWTSLGEFHRVLVPGGLYLIITGQSRTASFLSQQKHLERWTHQQSELDLGVGRRPVKFIVMRKK